MLSYLLRMLDNEQDRLFVEELFRTYKGLMFSEAVKLLNDYYMAEDLLQDALVRLIRPEPLQKLRKMNDAKRAAYLAATVRNLGRDWLRKKRSSKELLWTDMGAVFPEALQGEAAEERHLEALLLQREQILDFLNVWATLDAFTQELLERKYLLGESNRALAQRFDLAESSIPTLLRRARKRAISFLSKKTPRYPETLHSDK